jgi:RNA polymerase sigma-70 factor (ECF subfamily)
MTDTPRSLLECLRHQPNEDSWARFIDLYTPLLRRWLRKSGVKGADADDLMQEVFAVVIRELPGFEHNQRRGAFRHWLRTILVNRLRNFWRDRPGASQAPAQGEFLETLEHLDDPASDLSRLWDQEHDAFLAHRILELIEKDFNSVTWRAFRRVVLDGAKPAEVAAELGLSVNAVLLAKSRVLRRARQEIDGLID